MPSVPATSTHAPRALLVRSSIRVEITPFELSLLIEALQARAIRGAEDPEQIDYADFLFRRVAELREAGR
jgi:hypothetical protein